MAVNRAFIESESTQAWLGQFDPTDQETAQALLEAMLLVSRDSFAERLRLLVLKRMDEEPGVVGLFAEREIRKYNGKPNRLFRETKTKIKRAIGAGPRAVDALKAYDRRVGSEGLVAQLISELCKEFPARLLDHPSPDQIRKHQVRRFFLVTDLIGSGARALTYLDSAWRVRSVRSWWSTRQLSGVRFEVLAYATTPNGRKRVELHACQPLINFVVGCPTIDTVFGSVLRDRVRSLCIKMDPLDHDPVDSLGFLGSGALIAFAHGAPNNAPRMLYGARKNWFPLFPARVTSTTRNRFASEELDTDTVRAKLISLGQKRLASTSWLDFAPIHSRLTLLLLAALTRPPREDEDLSRRTRLTIFEVQQGIVQSMKAGWIDGRRRLTEDGIAILAKMRTTTPAKIALQLEPEDVYIPQSLRAPEKPSS